MVAAIFYSNPGFLFLSLIAVAISVWAIVDAARRPDWAWQASGQNRTLWLILNVVGLFVCGLVIGLVYLLGIRPKVAQAEAAGGPPGGGGYGAAPYVGGQYGAPSPYIGGPYGNPAPYGGAPPNSPAFGAPPYGGIGQDAPPPPPGPPPGWYPDPAGSGQTRYWNGVAWSGMGPT